MWVVCFGSFVGFLLWVVVVLLLLVVRSSCVFWILYWLSCTVFDYGEMWFDLVGLSGCAMDLCVLLFY